MPLKKLRIKLRYAKSVVYEEKKTIKELYNILWLLQVGNLQIVSICRLDPPSPLIFGMKVFSADQSCPPHDSLARARRPV